MKTHVFKHLFCNIHFSLYMFTNFYVKYVRWERMVEEGEKLYATEEH
jgi:hypothetical protein